MWLPPARSSWILSFCFVLLVWWDLLLHPLSSVLASACFLTNSPLIQLWEESDSSSALGAERLILAGLSSVLALGSVFWDVAGTWRTAINNCDVIFSLISKTCAMKIGAWHSVPNWKIDGIKRGTMFCPLQHSFSEVSDCKCLHFWHGCTIGTHGDVLKQARHWVVIVLFIDIMRVCINWMCNNLGNNGVMTT